MKKVNYKETKKTQMLPGHLRYLIQKSKDASKAYYNTGRPIMTDQEFDALVEQIRIAEDNTGVIYPDSPTQTVGYVVSDYFPKIMHEFPALSLDKTKDMDAYVKKFKSMNEETSIPGVNIMWKLDGSTLVVTYDDGKVKSVSTRGDGNQGSDITANAPYIRGIPTTIPDKGHVVVRGEAILTYTDFEIINNLLPEEERYSSPRNLANASIQLLDSRELDSRNVCFKAFRLVSSPKEMDRFSNEFEYMKRMGFDVVDSEFVNLSEMNISLSKWEQRVSDIDVPVDGLVCALEDVFYARGQEGTSHHPYVGEGYALKWADEEAETVLRDIEWKTTRTGLINPVAVFDPVELEGATLTKATLHNISYIHDLNLHKGDRITVIRANKVIPRVESNLDKDSAQWNTSAIIPDKCPSCGMPAVIVTSPSGTVTLNCGNDKCPAKKLDMLVHFCEKDCMNIKGMSEKTIKTLMDEGIIREPADFWHLREHYIEISLLPGFGKKSVDQMIEAAESARNTSFIPFVHSLGIPGIGKGQCKYIRDHYLAQGVKNVWKTFVSDGWNGDISNISGIGPIINASFQKWADENLQSDWMKYLLKEINIKDESVDEVDLSSDISGKTFVITGKLIYFQNRELLVKKIETYGGKVSGSVSKKTAYLINNDTTSTSGKNKKAKELGIPVISEKDMMDMFPS